MLPIRDTGKIYLYQLLTLGFYFLYWCQRAGREMNQLAGRQLVPSAWLLIVPFGAYWWTWQYNEAAMLMSQRRIKKGDIFLIYVAVTAVWIAPWGYFQWIPSGSDSTDISSGVWIVLGVLTAFVLLASIVGNAIFCALTQKKLNHVFGSPTSPQTLLPPAGPPAPVAPMQ